MTVLIHKRGLFPVFTLLCQFLQALKPSRTAIPIRKPKKLKLSGPSGEHGGSKARVPTAMETRDPSINPKISQSIRLRCFRRAAREGANRQRRPRQHAKSQCAQPRQCGEIQVEQGMHRIDRGQIHPHNQQSRDDPEMPGSTMAEMASAPERNR